MTNTPRAGIHTSSCCYFRIDFVKSVQVCFWTAVSRTFSAGMDSKPDEIYEKEQDTKYTNYSCRDKSCPAIPEILLCSPDGIVYRKAGVVDPGQETAIIIICGGSEKAYPQATE